MSKSYGYLDDAVEKALREEVMRYRREATEERRLAAAEAATATGRMIESGSSDGASEGARQLERELAEEVLGLQLD